MKETIIGVTLKVNSLPDLTGESGYLVITNDRGELWYYGLYDDHDKAEKAVKENDTRFMVKI